LRCQKLLRLRIEAYRFELLSLSLATSPTFKRSLLLHQESINFSLSTCFFLVIHLNSPSSSPFLCCIVFPNFLSWLGAHSQELSLAPDVFCQCRCKSGHCHVVGNSFGSRRSSRYSCPFQGKVRSESDKICTLTT
jgi:hypothetical protein